MIKQPALKITAAIVSEAVTVKSDGLDGPDPEVKNRLIKQIAVEHDMTDDDAAELFKKTYDRAAESVAWIL